MRAEPGEPALFVAALALVGVSSVLGGASPSASLPLMGVELTSLPALMLALRPSAERQAASRPPRFACTLLVALVALPLLQVVPLPPAAWTRLPGRAPVVQILRAAELPLSWRPVSLAPGLTLDAALALLAPAAMFVAAIRLGERRRRELVLAWAALGVAGLTLGAAQLAAPVGGGPYLWTITNFGSLVGFFANRNHEATFLLALLPLTAAVATTRPGRGAAILAGLFFVLAIVGLGVVRSRAGVLLAAPTLAAVAAMLWRSRRSGGWRAPAWALGAAAVVSMLAVALFGFAPIAQRFEPAAAEFRFEAWPRVEEIARAHLPLGGGLGSFDRLYRAAEPLNEVGPEYFNHAHNDFLELWLEAGWPAAALLAAFLVWFARAAIWAWSAGDERAALARAASVAIAVALAHSAVDYPLRTETMATLIAFCCGVLAAPLAGAAGRSSE